MVFILIGTGLALIPHVAHAILLQLDRRATAVMHPGKTAFRARKGFFELRGLSIVYELDLVGFDALNDRWTGTGEQRLFRFTDH